MDRPLTPEERERLKGYVLDAIESEGVICAFEDHEPDPYTDFDDGE